jgi:hypothetical protein
MTFLASDARSCWRLARWDADLDDDLRGVPPGDVRPVGLADVLDLVAPGVRAWVRASHRQAIAHCRAAITRANAAGSADLADTAERLLSELERQDAEADLRFAPSSGAS